MRFATCCFHSPSRGGHRWSLSRAVHRQLSAEADPPRTPAPSTRPPRSRSVDPTAVLATRVSAKLEEGDFRGAVRVASSEDRIADMSESTLTAPGETSYSSPEHINPTISWPSSPFISSVSGGSV